MRKHKNPSSIKQKDTKKPIGPIASEWANYSLSIWRRVNDAIIWIACDMQRHIVKRLCLYRPRTYLDENNPTSIMSLLENLNSNPDSIALWNDATSSVDIGDITLLEAGKLKFVEVKEGKINNAILEILMEKDPSNLSQALNEFSKTHGTNKMKQLERVKRQISTSHQAIELLNNDEGVDPLTGKKLVVLEIHEENKYWNEELNSLLREALKEEREVLTQIEDCLWIYADGNPENNFVQARDHFINTLKKGEPRLTTTIRRNDLGRPVALYEGLYHPVSVPLFLRPIDSDLVGEVLYGHLYRKVFFYFDWVAFSKKIREAGGTFGWANKKEAARELSQPWDLRPFMIFGELPKDVVMSSF